MILYMFFFFFGGGGFGDSGDGVLYGSSIWFHGALRYIFTWLAGSGVCGCLGIRERMCVRVCDSN